MRNKILMLQKEICAFFMPALLSPFIQFAEPLKKILARILLSRRDRNYGMNQ